MLVIFAHVYIIQIDHNTDVQEIRENIVHKLLKYYRSIDKAKGHYKPLE